MRVIRSLIIIFIIAIIGVYFFEESDETEEVEQHHDMDEKASVLELKNIPETRVKDVLLEGDLYQFIGESSDVLVESLGEPLREDQSAYTYQWWIYNNYPEDYIQFGVEDNEVKTIYAIGPGLDLSPIEIGQSYDEIVKEFSFSNEVEYKDGVSSYTFRLTEEDLRTRPLVKLADDIFLQLYFDSFTEQLSSVRVMQADILLRTRPYEVVYRGSLPEEINLSDDDWQRVQAGMEQQIFDITNMIRDRFEKPQLEWQDDLSEVAFLHSKDMHDNQYFSHYSEDGDGLKERLDGSGLFYVAAGENIAAQYPDAPAAIEGWLNSEGHREALLTDEYTHLGVGVYRLYYTQNFLVKPM